MARDWNSYYRLIRSLFPRGRAWNIDSGVMKELVQGKAVELARVDARVDALLLERNTLTTTELLSEFEAEFGLPDDCIDPSTYTTAERRAALNTKLTSLGSLRPNYYIGIAESLGYTGVTVTMYTPFWCGLGVSGDPCGDQETIFYWTLKWTYDMTKPLQDGQDLECLVNRYKPAHTVAIVLMTGPQFSNDFSSAFYAYPAVDLTLGGAFRTAFDRAFDVNYGGAFDKAFTEDFDMRLY